MLPSILRRLHDFSRRLLVRILLIALCAFLAIGLAKVFGHTIPFGLKDRIGADAVDRILSIIANSMLAVTTFSLTVMAASHRNAQSQWTPRAHQVLLQDTTTHTVLATFVGAYLYALIVIILRETDVFKGEELVVLFFVTLLVVTLVVVAIIRWISHMELLGSLIETAQRIEDLSAEAFAIRSDYPALGAVPFDGDAPAGLLDIRSDKTGYIQQVYQDRLQEQAAKEDAEIYLLRPVGTFVHQGEVLAKVRGPEEACTRMIRAQVSIGTLRNYAQDPEFGLQNLTEIGQRALSSGINDPGTAVDMLRRVSRVLLGARPAQDEDREVLYDRLHVRTLPRGQIVLDTIGGILRHGLDQPEVLAAGRQSLEALVGQGDRAIADAARRLLTELDEKQEQSLFAAGSGAP